MKLHLPAEWAPQSAVQLTLPHEGTDWQPMLSEVMPCFRAIAHTISRFQKVLVVCQDIETAMRDLEVGSEDSKFIFVEAPSNDTWARDHGGITVVNEENENIVLDFVFNGWGLKFAADHDNLITRRIADSGALKCRVLHGGIVLEGGGIESDGQGTLLTTAECLLSPNRNPHMTKADIEEHLKRVFGVERVLWVHHGYLAGDDTDSHIDTLARLCTPDTIAYVRCEDTTDEHYEALQKMEAELQSFKQLNGEPYNLIALPWPDACFDEAGNRLPATYANFLIINGAVLVPTYGLPQDQAALDILKPVFPDREIIGINCRTLIEQHGSLHCVTMQYPEGVV
jgi:agmatine deiminase